MLVKLITSLLEGIQQVISFQITNDGKTIQIECDDQGIDTLLDVLTKLRGSGRHIHLWAPSAQTGRAMLSDITPFGEEAVAEVIIGHGGD